MPLLEFTNKGIYCPAADVYIDPWKPVNKALITHGHSDHARLGHKQYIAADPAVPVIRYRLGPVNIEAMPFGKSFTVNGVRFSFHPAGHIVGSAQIKVEYKGEIWVISGDYKVEDDGLSEAFEPVKCHTFISECTFGLPVYSWPQQEEVYTEMNRWWAKNKAEGKTSLLIAYSLGKAQRVMHHLDPSLGKIYTHGAVDNINQVMSQQGIRLPDSIRVTPDLSKDELAGNMVIALSSALASPWIRKFTPYESAMASGWMRIRGIRRRRATDKGFVISDHADWQGLLSAIRATGAENIITTHGYTAVFARHLREQGWNARTEETPYEGELTDKSNEEE